VEAHLADLSWDNTQEKMLSLINNQLEQKLQYKPEKKGERVCLII